MCVLATFLRISVKLCNDKPKYRTKASILSYYPLISIYRNTKDDLVTVNSKCMEILFEGTIITILTVIFNEIL